MKFKHLVLLGLRALKGTLTSHRYWGKSPGAVMRLHRKRLEQAKATRQRRKRWRYRNRRYPAYSQRRA